MITKFSNFNLILEKSTLSTIITNSMIRFLHSIFFIPANVEIHKIVNDRTVDIIHNKIYPLLDSNKIFILKDDDSVSILINLNSIKVFKKIELIKDRLDKVGIEIDYDVLKLTTHSLTKKGINIDLKETITKDIIILRYNNINKDNYYYVERQYLDDYLIRYFTKYTEIYYIQVSNLEKYEKDKKDIKESNRFEDISNIIINRYNPIYIKMIKKSIEIVKKLISEKVLLIDLDNKMTSSYIVELQSDLKNLIEHYNNIKNNDKCLINANMYFINNLILEKSTSFTDEEIARQFFIKQMYKNILSLNIMRYKKFDILFETNPEYYKTVKNQINDIDLLKKWQHLDAANSFDLI